MFLVLITVNLPKHEILCVYIVGIKDVVLIDSIITFVLMSCYDYDKQTDSQLA